MKIRYFIALILAGSFLFITACKQDKPVNAIALEKLDSLIFLMGTSQQDIADLSKNKVDSIRNIISETQQHFNEVFIISDTAAFKVADEYAKIDKPLKKYSTMHESMEEQLHQSLIQLKSLQHDAQYELMDSVDINKYLIKEEELCKQVNEKVRLIYNFAKTEVIRFDSIQPIMLKTIELLKQD